MVGPWDFHEKLIVAHLVNTFPVFIKLQILLPCSQKPVIELYLRQMSLALPFTPCFYDIILYPLICS